MRNRHLLPLGVLSLSLAGCGVGQVRGVSFGDALAWQRAAELALCGSVVSGAAAFLGLWWAVRTRNLGVLVTAIICAIAAVYLGSTVAGARVQAERYACTAFPPHPPAQPSAEQCAAVLEAWRSEWIYENEAVQH